MPIDEDAKNPSVVQIVVSVAQPFGEVGYNCTFTKVGVVAKAIDLVLFLVRDGGSIVYFFQEVQNAVGKTGFRTRQRNHTHTCLLAVARRGRREGSVTNYLPNLKTKT